MGTSEVVADRWETSLGRRVAIVMAKQRLEASGDSAEQDVRTAIDLLDLTLQSEDWAKGLNVEP